MKTRYAVRLEEEFWQGRWLGRQRVDSRLGPVESTLRYEWDSRREAVQAAHDAGFAAYRYKVVEVNS